MLMLPKDSTIIGYVMSDENGSYKLTYNGNVEHLLIAISAFDIKQQFKKVDNRTQRVNFVADEGSIVIEEVIVKPTKMWGGKDTINYSVAAFKSKKDIVIGDVLKKIPGINVKESGEITYKGKAINKFYIENMDMLQGRYGIATTNVSADDISTVQVLENHQPIKALDKTEFSNSAAINLKIKEGKKGIFSIMAMLGLGMDKGLLWQEELTGMYFGKGRQHLSTYKASNNGTDISKELRSFTADNTIGELQITHVQQPSPPSIRFERYNFNNTHAVTTSNLFKLKNEAEVNVNLIFYNNKDRRHSYARTSYLLPGDSIQVITEDISAQNTTNNIEGEFRYNLNKDRNYFNNYLNISANWDNGTGEVQTLQQVGQQLDNKSFSANNTTHWIKRGENEKGMELLLKNVYHTQPHRLTISPGLYPDLFNNGTDYDFLTQNVRYNAFASNNRFSFLSAIVIGKVRINPTANVNVEHQTMSSDFDVTTVNNISHPITAIEMQNDIAWTRISSSVSPDVSYNSQNLKINFSAPILYRYTIIDNRLEDDSQKRAGKFYFQPSLSVQYSFTNQLEATAQGVFYTQSPGMRTLYTGYILQNYRNINRYDTRSFDSNRLFGSVGASYKNILDMFFAGGDISYSRYSSDGMYGQTFDGLLTVTQLNMQRNSGNMLSVNGRISKGLYWKALVISAEASWGKSLSDQLRQDQLVNYQSQWISANATVNLKPFRWLIAEYKASWGRSHGNVSTGERFPTMQSLNHRATIDILLPFDISLTGGFEHYYNSALQSNKHFSLADAGLTYTYKGARFSLDWTNILNTAKYVSASYGALNSYYSEYDIRPMGIMITVRFKLL
ncbi:MAG: hypothetical protein GX857_09195 [Bacteroidales bacterium]|nr:hypothetical protein [Bacteroidales bacterium]